MITQSIDIHIDAPPDRVFAWLTDASNHPRWDTTSVKMEPDSVPWRAGTEFAEVRRIGGRRTTVRSRCRALVEGQSFDMDSLSGPEFHGHWRFSPQNGGTLLHWDGELHLRGPARLFEPLIQRSFRRQTSLNFSRLKEILETEQRPTA